MPLPTRTWKPSLKCPRPTQHQASPNPRRRLPPRRPRRRRPGPSQDASFRRPSDYGSKSNGRPRRRRRCRPRWHPASCPGNRHGPTVPRHQARHVRLQQARVRKLAQPARAPPVPRLSRCLRGPVGQALAFAQRIRARGPRVQWEGRGPCRRNPFVPSSRACRRGRVNIRNGPACRAVRPIGQAARDVRLPHGVSRRGQRRPRCLRRRRRLRARLRWPKA